SIGPSARVFIFWPGNRDLHGDGLLHREGRRAAESVWFRRGPALDGWHGHGQTRRMKRRQFLKSAGLAGAGTLILPRTRLFGAEAPRNKLHIALIGTWARVVAR